MQDMISFITFIFNHFHTLASVEFIVDYIENNS